LVSTGQTGICFQAFKFICLLNRSNFWASAGRRGTLRAHRNNKHKGYFDAAIDIICNTRYRSSETAFGGTLRSLPMVKGEIAVPST
jgi:hypothetical protein